MGWTQSPKSRVTRNIGGQYKGKQARGRRLAQMIPSVCKIPAVEYSELSGESAREPSRNDKIGPCSDSMISLTLWSRYRSFAWSSQLVAMNQEGPPVKLDQTRLFPLPAWRHEEVINRVSVNTGQHSEIRREGPRVGRNPNTTTQSSPWVSYSSLFKLMWCDIAIFEAWDFCVRKKKKQRKDPWNSKNFWREILWNNLK